MKITWLGHACFLIESADGTRLVCDPFDDAIGYPAPHVFAHAALMSHGHHDHNNIGALLGDPIAVTEPEVRQIGAFKIYGVPLYHDAQMGAQRGRDIAFVMEADALRVAHLGDLGHPLDAEQAAAIGHPDVLMLPVGGTYTIDAATAYAVMRSLAPRITIPMHYQTDRLTLGKVLAPLDDFIALCGPCHALDGNTLEVAPGDGLAGVCIPRYAG